LGSWFLVPGARLWRVVGMVAGPVQQRRIPKAAAREHLPASNARKARTRNQEPDHPQIVVNVSPGITVEQKQNN
jgi:hypothetical protein